MVMDLDQLLPTLAGKDATKATFVQAMELFEVCFDYYYVISKKKKNRQTSLFTFLLHAFVFVCNKEID